MTIKGLFLCFSVLALIPAGVFAQPIDVYVDDDWVGTANGTDPDGSGPATSFGTDAFAVIQDGVDNVATNGTVWVRSGTYQTTARVLIDRPMTLNGPRQNIDPRPTSTLGGGTGGTTRIPNDPSTEAVIDLAFNSSTVLEIRAHDVEVNGFSITNGAGDLLESEDDFATTWQNINVRYNIVSNSPTVEGIQIRSADNALIEFNYVFNTGGEGINLGAFSANSTIRWNEVWNSHSFNGAIAVSTSTNITVRENVIAHTTNDPPNSAIDLGVGNTADQEEGIHCVGNVIKGTSGMGSGIEVDFDDAIVENNVIEQNTFQRAAIVLQKTETDNAVIRNNIIEKNTLTDPFTGAILIDIAGAENPPVGGYTIRGNLLLDNEPFGIFNRGASQQLTLSSNIFDGNQWSIGLLDNASMLIIDNQFISSQSGHIRPMGQFAALQVHGNMFTDLIVYFADASDGAPFSNVDISGNRYEGIFGTDSGQDPNDGFIDGFSVDITAPGSSQTFSDDSVIAQFDQDADGYPDRLELIPGNPTLFNVADTDGDGVPDGAEIALGTNPDNINDFPAGFSLAQDTDSDGYVDWYERAFGTIDQDENSHPTLGDVVSSGIVTLSDAVRALQIVNGAVAFDFDSGDLDAINVTGISSTSLTNPLQILRFQIGARQSLPGLPGID